MTAAHPLVSVLIPCRNEESTILTVLEAIRAQTYPAERMEIVAADGRSADRTRELMEQFARQNPASALRVVDNPGLTAPAALNAALNAARGEIILRMDAHSIPAPDYVERCVDLLSDPANSGVGGAWDVSPGGSGVWSRAIAAAAMNPFSTGGARYRSGGRAGAVETVPFGAYRREVFDQVGRFNEAIPVNEDYEFNYRVRKAGGRIYFSPEIRSRYIARPTIGALTRQYFSYGRQKAATVAWHPGSLKLRQAVPALFLPAVLAAALTSFCFPLGRWAAGLLGVSYLALSTYFSITDAIRRRDPALWITLPVVFFVIHASWSAGFWAGIAGGLRGKGKGRSD